MLLYLILIFTFLGILAVIGTIFTKKHRSRLRKLNLPTLSNEVEKDILKSLPETVIKKIKVVEPKPSDYKFFLEFGHMPFIRSMFDKIFIRLLDKPNSITSKEWDNIYSYVSKHNEEEFERLKKETAKIVQSKKSKEFETKSESSKTSNNINKQFEEIKKHNAKDSKYCINCGAELPTNAKFCKKCGKKAE